MSTEGVDLGGIAAVVKAITRPQTEFGVTATPLLRLADGTPGLFLVESAERVDEQGVYPGYAVVFVPASWLLEAATDTGDVNASALPSLQIRAGGGSAGDLHGAAPASSRFTEAGLPFEVLVPRSGVRGAAAALPWIVLAGGLLLAGLAWVLGVFAERREKAKAELDRLFTLTPDLIVVAGFDGYFKRVNPAFEQLLGYSEEEALARPYVEFVHPDDRVRTEAESSRIRGTSDDRIVREPLRLQGRLVSVDRVDGDSRAARATDLLRRPRRDGPAAGRSGPARGGEAPPRARRGAGRTPPSGDARRRGGAAGGRLHGRRRRGRPTAAGRDVRVGRTLLRRPYGHVRRNVEP